MNQKESINCSVRDLKAREILVFSTCFELVRAYVGGFDLIQWQYNTVAKSTDSGDSIWVQVPILPPINFTPLSKLPTLFMPQFPHP